MVVGPDVPAKTIPEFIAFAKANPGKVYYASPGTGTSVMMSAELFKDLARVELSNITYRGMNGGGYTDLFTNRVQVAFDNLPGSIGYIHGGQLRALERYHDATLGRSARRAFDFRIRSGL